MPLIWLKIENVEFKFSIDFSNIEKLTYKAWYTYIFEMHIA